MTSLRTKANIIIAIFIASILVATSVYAVTRTISDTNDNLETFIRCSNGNYYAPTAANLQTAIQSLNSSGGGTVWLGGDITTDVIIHIWNDTTLNLCTHTIAADSSFTSGSSQGVFEIGKPGNIVRNVTICDGVIVGNNYTSYPTTSGNNANIYGIYSSAVMQNCSIQNIRFNNLFGSILLEGLGKINGK